MTEAAGHLSYRTIFISDVHLGMRSCQASALLDFLKYVDADTLYLVGDIVDFWKVRRGPHWPQSHNDFLQKLLRKSRKGAVSAPSSACRTCTTWRTGSTMR